MNSLTSIDFSEPSSLFFFFFFLLNLLRSHFQTPSHPLPFFTLLCHHRIFQTPAQRLALTKEPNNSLLSHPAAWSGKGSQQKSCKCIHDFLFFLSLFSHSFSSFLVLFLGARRMIRTMLTHRKTYHTPMPDMGGFGPSAFVTRSQCEHFRLHTPTHFIFQLFSRLRTSIPPLSHLSSNQKHQQL